MFKKKLIISCLIGMLVFSNIVPTFAAPDDVTTETTVDSGDELPEPLEDTTNESADEWSEGDVITKTTKDEENCCQLTFSCKMPKYFNLGAYVLVKNESNGKTYKILATQGKEFNARMFVPEGYYTILECGIDGDGINEYPMIKPEDFDMESNGRYTLESTLVNYDEIEQEALRRVEGHKKDIPQEEKVEEEPVVVEEKPLEVLPWRIVNHTGTGPEVTLTGTSNVKMDLIVKITKTGFVKDGEFQYSTDNGKTWSKTALIRDTKLVLTDDMFTQTGLTLSFPSTNEYVANDTYTYTSQVEYFVEMQGLIGKGQMRMTSSETPYDYKTTVGIVIDSSGPLDKAMFSYAFDYDVETKTGTFSETIPIPANGVYEIPDTPFIITFWDGWGDFKVGDTYIISLDTEKSPIDYTPFIVGVVVVVGIVCFSVIMFLLSKKEKPFEYKITPYKRVSIEPKRKKK